MLNLQFLSRQNPLKDICMTYDYIYMMFLDIELPGLRRNQYSTLCSLMKYSTRYWSTTIEQYRVVLVPDTVLGTRITCTTVLHYSAIEYCSTEYSPIGV